MKEFIKKPENWGKPKVEQGNLTASANTSVQSQSTIDPNRARIEAKIAEIKAKLQSK